MLFVDLPIDASHCSDYVVESDLASQLKAKGPVEDVRLLLGR